MLKALHTFAVRDGKHDIKSQSLQILTLQAFDPFGQVCRLQSSARQHIPPRGLHCMTFLRATGSGEMEQSSLQGPPSRAPG